MMAEAERAHWIFGLSKPSRIVSQMTAAFAPGLIAGVLGVVCLARVVGEGTAEAVAIMMFVIAGLSGIAALAGYRTNAALTGRLDRLRRALDAAADRDQLFDILDNAPIGFYSVDVNGRFRFVNQTLARWLGSAPSEIMAGGARLHDFLACPPSPGASPVTPFAAQDAGIERGEVVLKTREGGVIPAWIGQNVVGSGAELHTRSVVCDLTPARKWKAALRSSQRFERCFANAPVGIALLD